MQTQSAISPASSSVRGPEATIMIGTSRGRDQCSLSSPFSPQRAVSPRKRLRQVWTYWRKAALVATSNPIVRSALSPRPTPKTARLPPPSSSMEAIALAATAGCRVTGLVTPGPIFRCRVCNAAAVMIVYTSGQSSCESTKRAKSRPAASAARATSISPGP